MITLCTCRFRKYFPWGEKGMGGGGPRDSVVLWVAVGSPTAFFRKCHNLNLINFNFPERALDHFHIAFLIVYNYTSKIMKKIKDMNFK